MTHLYETIVDKDLDKLNKRIIECINDGYCMVECTEESYGYVATVHKVVDNEQQS